MKKNSSEDQSAGSSARREAGVARMWRRIALGALVLVASVALAACGDDPGENGSNGGAQFEDAVLADQEDAEEWANASAPQIYFVSIFTPMLITMGEEEDENCPVVNEDSAAGLVEVSGGCTDLDGRTWSGSMTIQEGEFSQELWFPGGDQDLSISELVIDDFGFVGTETCASDPEVEGEVDFTLNGKITTEELGGDRFGFSVELRIDGKGMDAETCEISEGKGITTYEGEVEVLEFDSATGMGLAHRWNGSGTRADPEVGQAAVETVDEVLDAGGCEFKPMSGSTKVSAGGVEMEFIYNGETHCDEEATVTWYLDGEEMGVVEGVACSSARGGPVGPAMVLLMLMMVAFQRRSARA